MSKSRSQQSNQSPLQQQQQKYLQIVQLCELFARIHAILHQHRWVLLVHDAFFAHVWSEQNSYIIMIQHFLHTRKKSIYDIRIISFKECT